LNSTTSSTKVLCPRSDPVPRSKKVIQQPFQIIARAGEEPRLEKRPRKSKKVSKFIDDEADESDEESLIKNTSDLVKRKLAE
jgi:hypothetical protein